jgi:hypothetical protein
MKARNENSITLTVPEAQRVYEYLDGPCPRDDLEQGLADKIAQDLGLPLLPKLPPHPQPFNPFTW